MGWYSSKPTPLEALKEAIFYGFAANTSPFAKPGAVVSRLPPAQREALSRLTKRDMENIILPSWFGAPRRRGRFNLRVERNPHATQDHGCLRAAIRTRRP